MASSSSSGRRLDGTLTLRTGAASLIPGLPDDVAAVILCLLTFPDQSRLRATSRAWRLLLSAAALLPLRRSLRLPRRHLLCLFPTDPSLASPILLDPAAPTAWWPLPPIPCSPQLYGLANFAAIAVGRHLYVLGGSRFDARSYPLGHPSPSAAAYRLDLSLSRHRWERLPDMRFPRGSFACAPEPSGGVIVAGGGSRHPTFPSYGSRTSGTEWYDTAARAWRVAAVMPRERAGCVGFIVHGAGDGMEDEFWVMGGYDGYTTVGGVVPNDVYCRDAVALRLWSGKWREIGNMWEEGERRRLGPVAAISTEDGRVPEVFMLDGHDVFRDQLHRDVSVDRDLIDIFARGVDHDEVLLLAVRASRAENQDAIDAAMVGMLADPKEARADIKVVHFLPFKRTALTYVDLADVTWHRTNFGPLQLQRG